MSGSSARMSITAKESLGSFSRVSDNESTFANETGFQSDHSSTESPTSATEIDHVSDDYDSANLEDEVDDFSSFFVDSVAYSGEESSSESLPEASIVNSC